MVNHMNSAKFHPSYLLHLHLYQYYTQSFKDNQEKRILEEALQLVRSKEAKIREYEAERNHEVEKLKARAAANTDESSKTCCISKT